MPGIDKLHVSVLLAVAYTSSLVAKPFREYYIVRLQYYGIFKKRIWENSNIWEYFIRNIINLMLYNISCLLLGNVLNPYFDI